MNLLFFSALVAYEEMSGEDEQTGKQQVVVHLTLQEYKVGEIIKHKLTKLMYYH